MPNQLKSIHQALADRDVLVADGATGTMLFAAGLPPSVPPELWNLEYPGLILELHKAYLKSGSQIILTNSFGGSRIKLEKFKLGSQAHELNVAAAQLARQAAGHSAFVAGDIGPTGDLMMPLGTLTYETAFDCFHEQATALAEGGVDLLWVETMTDLQEAKAAVIASRQAAPSIPVFATLSFGPTGRTIMGVSGKQAAAVLKEAGAAAIGVNCGEGLEAVELVLSQMAETAPDLPLIAKPNAGRPRMIGDQIVYDTGPADFAEYASGYIERGACIIGSCCGSTPEYIAAIRRKVK